MTDDGLQPNAALYVTCLEYALNNFCTPDEFLERFPIQGIMEELSDDPDLRAKILIAGLETFPPKSALDLPHSAVSVILQTMLEAGETTPAKILSAFSAEDRVRKLHWPAIFSFITSKSWWTEPSHKAKARELFAKVFSEARESGLLSNDELRDLTGINHLVEGLASKNLGLLKAVATASLRSGTDGDAFTGDHIFSIVSANNLCAAVPLEHLYEKVFLPLADACGWRQIRSSAPRPRPSVPPDEGWESPAKS